WQFAIPFAACGLVLGLLIGGQVAIVTSLMSVLLTAFLLPNGLALAGFSLAGSIAAVYSVQRYRTRNAVTYASVTVAVVNASMVIVAVLIASHQWNAQRIAGGMLLGILGAFLTGAIASLAIPIYESAFDIMTDLKLLELSNADNPLLRQLAIQTPGTSHH